MKCRYCGANLKKGSTFCGSCGTQVQLTINTGGSGTVQGAAKTTKHLVIGAIALLLVAATVIVGALLWQQDQEKQSAARLTEVSQYADSIYSQVAAVSVNGSQNDRSGLVQQLDWLEQLSNTVNTDLSTGVFTLYDGTLYDVSPLQESIAQKEEEVREALMKQPPLGMWTVVSDSQTYSPVFEASGTYFLEMPDHAFEGTWERFGEEGNGSVKYVTYFLSGYLFNTYYYDPIKDTLTDQEGKEYIRAS